MSKHYFIGIKIPAGAAEKLDAERKTWNLTSHKRYTPAIDMHITLVFIGGDAHGDIHEAAKALENVQQAPFSLTINGVETFGNPSTPRIIYASVENSQALNQLQEHIRQQLQPYRFNLDAKPFVPHITLAGKWKGGKPIETKLDVAAQTFEVNEFSIFQIEPAQVPRYIPIYTYPLKEES